ncbi:hypothetical protein WEN_01625 [Mycoplasma wenyonii str. Massachusetts]|uniref:Uncharacterized protein n=1 Tax=Mycoplasma wenyonii (strain Massachusetts) TaxID=1197325 RepID=I6Z6A8_MYCWM|nr:hypothetical protein [Mycoplasma wenyonii]AFN65118.1 hypothetical protein WEN_01625 [Mycoplasma wenyonii str. Massachusetts]
MLIPKVFFLGLASSVGIGSLVPLSSLTAKGDDPTAWIVNSRDSFPLFTCSSDSGSHKIKISLKFENNSAGTNNKKIIFEGYDEIQRKSFGLYDTEQANLAPVKLIIYGTGTVKLVDAGSGMDSYQLPSSGLSCKPNIFEVTKYNGNYGHELSDKQWEKEFKDIALTLGDCVDKDGSKECLINIGDQVGLKWKTEFTPKAII